MQAKEKLFFKIINHLLIDQNKEWVMGKNLCSGQEQSSPQILQV